MTEALSVQREAAMKRITELALLGFVIAQTFLSQTPLIHAQTSQPAIESPRISTLSQEIVRGTPAAIDSFWKKLADEGTPLIELHGEDPTYVLVTFVWRADAETGAVRIRGPLTDIDEPDELVRLADTDLWHESVWMRKDTRTDYQFVVGDGPTAVRLPDPLNPKRWVSKRDDLDREEVFSVVELPHAPPQRWVAADAAVPHGKVERHDWKSAILDNNRHVWVYTPPDYKTNGARYGLLVTSDGYLYTTAIPTPTILDNLIAAKRIPPIVALFIGNAQNPNGDSERQRELVFESTRFSDLLTKELLPWVRVNYCVSHEPEQNTITGRSAGGLAAGVTAWRHPEVFGNVLSQSGSYFWKPAGDTEAEWFARQVATSTRRPIRFYLDAGTLESTPVSNTTKQWIQSDAVPGGVSLLAANRHLRDLLTAKGYFVEYRERPGGHLLGGSTQAAFFAEGLIALLASKNSP